jgi:hypothetical protein
VISSGNGTYGCSSTKDEALYTLSWTTMYRSFFVECLATSLYESSSDISRFAAIVKVLLIRWCNVLVFEVQSDWLGGRLIGVLVGRS